MFRRVVLFWHDDPPPKQVRHIKAAFEKTWSQYDVILYNDVLAKDFIKQHFGEKELYIYANCRIPAMRSDLFRLFYMYKYGGLWIDVKFLPQLRPPDEIMFGLNKVDIICFRWPHGRIVNGVFASRAKGYVINSLLEKALANIIYQRFRNIYLLTGPGMWIDVLKQYNVNEDYDIVSHDVLFKQFLRKQKFELSGRGGDTHWSERQKKEPLFYF